MGLLSWQQVSFAYDGRFEINQVDFDLKPGDFTLLFGPNGAGKTTLFKLGCGFLKPAHGQISLDGKAIETWKQMDIAKKVAYLEQEVQYIFPFTVEEVVLLGRFPHTAHQFWDRKEDLEIVAWAMEMTGTLRFAKRSIFQLSGGERRKVEIARALCQQPELLLLDEPTPFLDVKQKIDFFEILARMNQKEGIAIGLISHEISLAKPFVKKAVFMRDGRVLETGAPDQMLTDSRVRKLFGLTH